MTVYVDKLRSVVTTPKWPWSQGCHLFSNNRQELHDFAFNIDLQAQWFQNRPHFPHYDLTKGKRIKALFFGAIEVTDKQVATFLRCGVIDEDLDDGN